MYNLTNKTRIIWGEPLFEDIKDPHRLTDLPSTCRPPAHRKRTSKPRGWSRTTLPIAFLSRKSHKISKSFKITAKLQHHFFVKVKSTWSGFWLLGVFGSEYLQVHRNQMVVSWYNNYIIVACSTCGNSYDALLPCDKYVLVLHVWAHLLTGLFLVHLIQHHTTLFTCKVQLCHVNRTRWRKRISYQANETAS